MQTSGKSTSDENNNYLQPYMSAFAAESPSPIW